MCVQFRTQLDRGGCFEGQVRLRGGEPASLPPMGLVPPSVVCPDGFQDGVDDRYCRPVCRRREWTMWGRPSAKLRQRVDIFPVECPQVSEKSLELERGDTLLQRCT